MADPHRLGLSSLIESTDAELSGDRHLEDIIKNIQTLNYKFENTSKSLANFFSKQICVEKKR